MRNISCAITTDQILAQAKDVTRRLGWLHLKVGDLLQPVKKCMGLKPGEKVQKLGCPVRVKSVRREPLNALHGNYAYHECEREGFPMLTGPEFIAMFCKTHKGCKPETVAMVVSSKTASPRSLTGFAPILQPWRCQSDLP